MSQEATVERQAVVIKRTFAAPVEKVYQAWTDPAQMVQWFASNTRWVAPTIALEPMPGGKHDITMNHSDGDKFHVVGKYVEIVPNQKISFTWRIIEDESEPTEQLVTIDLRPVPGGTELTLTHDGLTKQENEDDTRAGWTGFLEMLDGFIAGAAPLASGE